MIDNDEQANQSINNNDKCEEDDIDNLINELEQ